MININYRCSFLWKSSASSSYIFEFVWACMILTLHIFAGSCVYVSTCILAFSKAPLHLFTYIYYTCESSFLEAPI